MSKMLVTVFIVLLCIGSSAFPAVLGTQEFGEISPEEWALTAPSTYPNSSAMVIFDKGFAVAELSGLELKHHVRVKIFADSGVAVMTPAVMETREYDGIDELRAVVYKPDGRVIEMGKDEIVEFSDDEVRRVTISFPGLEPGDIFEYAYRIKYYGGVDKLGAEKYFLFSQAIAWQWLKDREEHPIDWDNDLYKHVTNLPTWYFDHPVYTAYSELVVKLGSDLDYICLPSNISIDKAIPDSHRGSGIIDRVYKYHTWVLENLPPAIPEPYMKRPRDYRPTLHFQLFSNNGENRIITGIYSDSTWRNTGRNIQGYLNMYSKKKPRGFSQKAHSIVEGLETNHEKAVALYEYVRDNFEHDNWKYELRPSYRYIRDFYKKKSGSRAEFNILLLEFLKVVHVDAWPVLVSTRGEFNYRLTNRFNHLILFVEYEDGWAYLDASSPACPFGVLPYACRVNEGLLVDYGDSEIDQIRPVTLETFRQDSITLIVGKDLDGRADIKSHLGGYMALEALEYFLRFETEHPADTVPTALAGLEDLRDRSWEGVDSLDIEVSGSRKVERNGYEFDLSQCLWPMIVDSPFKSPIRNQPVDLVYPFSYRADLKLITANGHVLKDLPLDTTFSTPGAKCTVKVTSGPGRPTIELGISFEKAEFELVEYTGLRNFLNSIGKLMVVSVDR